MVTGSGPIACPWRKSATNYLAGTGTTGTVAVDGSATGEIEHPNDQDWFAVTLEAGKPYQIDLEGSRTNAGTLRSPYLRGVYDADGNLIGGTTDDDGGVSWNSRLLFRTGEFRHLLHRRRRQS